MVKFPYLRAEMILHGDNQKRLAEALGLKKDLVSMRLSGKTKWRLEEIIAICKRYNKNIEYLFKEEK